MRMIDGKEVVKTAFCVAISRGLTGLLHTLVIAFCVYICFYAPDLSINIKQFAMVIFWCMTIMIAFQLFVETIVEKFIDKLIDDAKNGKSNGGLNP